MISYTSNSFSISQKVTQAVDFIRSKTSELPETCIVIGSGLSSFSDHLIEKVIFPYQEIPFFPLTTVHGHSGELILGNLGNQKLWVLSGRFHYYEGYAMSETVFSLRVMKMLGVKNLILSNAAGGLNPSFRVGDLMLIEDQIDRFPSNPLRGIHEPIFGDRFPDMSEPFDLDWRKKAMLTAEEIGVKLQKGVYLGTSGPSLETRAEINYFRFIGGDAVGMSTVPEVIAGNQLGLKILGFSVITNECIPATPMKFTHEEVVHQAQLAGEHLVKLVKHLLK